MDIEKIETISSEIKNFRSAYEGIELWGTIDDPVPPLKMLKFMIDNPHMQQIANNIDKMLNSENS